MSVDNNDYVFLLHSNFIQLAVIGSYLNLQTLGRNVFLLNNFEGFNSWHSGTLSIYLFLHLFRTQVFCNYSSFRVAKHFFSGRFQPTLLTFGFFKTMHNSETLMVKELFIKYTVQSKQSIKSERRRDFPIKIWILNSYDAPIVYLLVPSRARYRTDHNVWWQRAMYGFDQ